MNSQQILKNVLKIIELETDKLYTLTLHTIGTVSNDDVIVGRVEDRTCKWKVEIFPQREKFHFEKKSGWSGNTPQEEVDQDIAEGNKKVDTEEDLFFLNGLYDSYGAIEEKIIELRLKNAVELFEAGKGGSLKSYRMTGRKENVFAQHNYGDPKKMEAVWETVCGVCGDVQTCTYLHEICQGKGCSSRDAKPTAPGVILCNNFTHLIPQTILENIKVKDGKVYHVIDRRFRLVTNLGTITPVYPEETWGFATSPVATDPHITPQDLKEMTMTAC